MTNFYKIGLLLVIFNTIINLLISKIGISNLCISNIVIVYNVFLIKSLLNYAMLDAFKIGLGFLFIIIGIITYSISLVIENKVIDNFYLLAIVILTFIQILLFQLIKTVSKS